MVADPHRRFMSVEEYLELDRKSPDARYEFIDGIVTMLDGGTANHSLIAANIISSLHTLLRGQSCRTYTSDMRVNIAGNRYVYPDVTVSCDERDLGAVETLHYPSLIVEVLSASTEVYDRGRKFGYYRSKEVQTSAPCSSLLVRSSPLLTRFWCPHLKTCPTMR